ncbi:MAG: LysR substrate-binding domain-containing protein [Pseudomonas marincola]
MKHAQLKAFHAVAKTGGFTLAAKSLGLTQPAITLQVRALERQYNTSLFERRGRQISLTTSGMLLLNLSTRYFGIEQEAQLFLDSIMQVKSGHLRIGCDIAPRAFPITADFKNQYPSVDLNITISSKKEILENLIDHLIDVVITDQKPENSAINHQVISEEKVTLTLPVYHRLAATSQVIGPELKDLKILLYLEDGKIGEIEQNFIDQSGIPKKNIVMFKNREIIMEAIAHGEGVSLFSRKLVDHDRRLVSVPITDCDLVHTEYLAYHKNTQDTPLISAFRTSCNSD